MDNTEILANVKEAQIKILEHLVQLEFSIAELYEIYSAHFPQMKAFWHRLACEERAHAAQLKTMESLVRKGQLFRNIGRFGDKMSAITLEAVTHELKRINKWSITPIEGLRAALKIETSLAESHFYEVVDSDAPEFKPIAEKLLGDTREHADRILNEIRSSQSEGSSINTSGL